MELVEVAPGLREPANDEMLSAETSGHLFGSIVLDALAIELYLKVLRHRAYGNVPGEHHLWTLYKHLPQETKIAIEQVWDLVMQEMPALDLGGMREERDFTLKGVLLKISNALTVARYPYEDHGPNNGYPFDLAERVRIILRQFALDEDEEAEAA